MVLIVQKYGGTSVGSVERIQAVAHRIHRATTAGNSVVVVVSAMGKSTDELVQLAHQVSSQPSRREMDMLLSTGEQVSIALLSMALQELGQPAISLTGAQVGIVTEAEHAQARILRIQTERVNQQLKAGKVIVVAGFQGISDASEMEITTLGRGGSDTSAVALAVALQADRCEIYTDVPGILTTDPRLIPDARLMPEITCDEMLELASLGAKVLHPRAVELAKNYGMPLVVRSSWTEDPGTKVLSPSQTSRSMEGLELSQPVDGVHFDLDQAKVALLRVPDRPGVAAQLFGEIAQQTIDVDLIIQSIHEGNTNDIAFTVSRVHLDQTQALVTQIAPILGTPPDIGSEPAQTDTAVITDARIAKVSISGAGMIGRPGVAAQMFQSLAAAGVNIQMISTSEVQVSCLVNQVECDRAIQALCTTFQINQSPLQSQSETPQATAPTTTPPVRGIALDRDQARLAILRVPDHPGAAAKIFHHLAEANISVDMIIQSQRCQSVNQVETRDIAFTVAQPNAQQAKNCLDQIHPQLGFGEVTVDEAIAKISIVGSGMVNHPGVAAKMFSALSASQINIQMITTSEIKISCVVAELDGLEALRAIHKAFELSQDA